MAQSKGTPALSRREKLATIHMREAEKDLLVTKYRDKFRDHEDEAIHREVERFIESAAPMTEANLARLERRLNSERNSEDDSASVSAYTTGSTGTGGRGSHRGGSAPLSARGSTPVAPVIKSVRYQMPGSRGGSFSARGSRPGTGNSTAGPNADPKPLVMVGDAAYASAPLAAPSLAPVAEQPASAGKAPATPLLVLGKSQGGSRLATPLVGQQSQPQAPGLEWSVLDKLSAQLHKQDTASAKQKELELKKQLKADLDRQVADERLKQERAKEEEKNLHLLEAERTLVWAAQQEQQEKQRLDKIAATKKERDDQVALVRARKEEEKQREQQEAQSLISDLNRDLERDKHLAEERAKLRAQQQQQVLTESLQAAKHREEQQMQIAQQEKQSLEAYERLQQEREERKRQAASKEESKRKEIESNATARAQMYKKAADSTEAKAAAERAAKDKAAEEKEQAGKQKLENLRNSTQEYLLQQMKEKQVKKHMEAEKTRIASQSLAAQVKSSEAQEREKNEERRRRNLEHRSELERQMAARTRDKPNKEVMSECELRINKALLEKVTLALTDISGMSDAGKTS
eukprot:TRINITY_DN91271_c0_g1_i1.p1 TRINITY_DN91271_c0_g1~~TRINITY_DN91271_c0_g1_i1.p1  ORF type:complete len:577 (+),score=179.47 TRINITY_DN91271_c0_g1_i1:58-1788(+)